MNLPSFWERYRMLRSAYPHHMRLSCLLHAREFRDRLDWSRVGQRARI